jgi:hypothetical protein
MQELWEDRMNLVGVTQLSEDPEQNRDWSAGRASRLVNVLLDMVGYLKTIDARSSSRFLLDEKYASLLTEPERMAKDHILGLVQAFPEGSRQTGVFLQLRSLLKSMGHPDAESDGLRQEESVGRLRSENYAPR